MKDIVTTLREKDNISLITNPRKDPLDILKLVNNVIDVSYNYVENRNYFFEILHVLYLGHELKNISLNGEFAINNHPNIFLKRGDMNILHGFSFLDFIIDEYGNITNKFLFELIKLSKVYSIYDHSNFVANSFYTKRLSILLLEKLGITPSSVEILHPTFQNTRAMSTKDRGVLSFQRINREKKLDTVLEIAKHSVQHFIIAGAVNEGDQDYLNHLISNKPDNVEIITNPSEQEKEALFLGSKVFLHSNRKEHFGISVVEAMSHGLVPVVPKVGGPWTDILEEGKFGFGYSSQDELQQVLDEAMQTPEKRRMEIAESTIRFSPEVFSDKLRSLVELYSPA